MKHLLQLLNCSENSSTLLRNIYYSVGRNSKLKRIVLKAIKLQEKCSSPGDYAYVGFSYIEGKIGCFPMEYLHRVLGKTEANLGDYKALDYKEVVKTTNEKILKWSNEEESFLKMMRRQRMTMLFEKSIFLFGNLLAYLRFETEYSLLIFAFVNTIGLVMFIILDYDCCNVDDNKCDGNLSKRNSYKKRALARSRRLRGLYQVIGGMGLIINITMFVFQLLEQEALF